MSDANHLLAARSGYDRRIGKRHSMVQHLVTVTRIFALRAKKTSPIAFIKQAVKCTIVALYRTLEEIRDILPVAGM
jgi:hypothetical protein